MAIRRWRLSLALVLAATHIPVSSAQAADARAIVLPGATAFPESVTSTSDGALFVSSVHDGGVKRIRAGKVEDWIKPGAFGSRSTFGVLADERAGLLWVCSNDLSGFGIASPGDAKGSALLAFNLHTGRGEYRFMLPPGPALCNDMALGDDGSVYVTNSAFPAVLKLAKGSNALKVWASDSRFQPRYGGGLDGIALDADSNLYVTVLQSGEIFRIAMAGGEAGRITGLKLSRPMVMPDGLRAEGRDLIVAEGGGSLTRLTLDGDEAVASIVASDLAGPTGVTIVNHDAWVAEGQIAYLFDPAKRGASPKAPFRLISIPLKR